MKADIVGNDVDGVIPRVEFGAIKHIQRAVFRDLDCCRFRNSNVGSIGGVATFSKVEIALKHFKRPVGNRNIALESRINGSRFCVERKPTKLHIPIKKNLCTSGYHATIGCINVGIGSEINVSYLNLRTIGRYVTGNSRDGCILNNQPLPDDKAIGRLVTKRDIPTIPKRGLLKLHRRPGQRCIVIAGCCIERVQSNVTCNNQICCRCRKRGVSNGEVIGLARNSIKLDKATCCMQRCISTK